MQHRRLQWNRTGCLEKQLFLSSAGIY